MFPRTTKLYAFSTGNFLKPNVSRKVTYVNVSDQDCRASEPEDVDILGRVKKLEEPLLGSDYRDEGTHFTELDLYFFVHQAT